MSERAIPAVLPRIAGAVAVAALVAAVFSPVLGNGFVLYDDPAYITGNPWVNGGFSAEGIRQAFVSARSDNWHPLTWLSHMLDVTLFGLDPRGHHLVGVLIHAATAALLFLFLADAAGSAPAAFAAACLFALHPLRVESVAWASERKDLLCGLFWVLAMIAWTAWTRRGGAGRYALAAGALACALLSKGTAAVLPPALLVLDLWPLRRLALGWRRLALEKVPLALLGLAGAAAAWAAQRGSGALKGLDQLPVTPRILNALDATAGYLRMTVWPSGLAVFYPHPGPSIGWGRPLVAALLLAAVTAAALALRRSRPWVLAGWLLFLVPLLPVIGLVQVGWQSMADRYTYLPHLGLSVLPAWWASSLPARRRAAAFALLSAAAILLAAGSVAQIRHWRSSTALFTRAIEVTERNWAMEYSLGMALADGGDDAGAVVHFERALAIVPRFPEAREALEAARRRLGEAADGAGAPSGLRAPAGTPPGPGVRRDPRSR